MKTIAVPLAAFALLTALPAPSQGAFIFDQQSSADETPWPYGSGSTIQHIATPWGQSFTPSLASVGFIRLQLNDGNITDALGATMYINLRSGSITGTIIGTTTPLTMPNGFHGPATFLFPASVAVAPGTTYYYEPILQSGGTWNIGDGEFSYPGGTAYAGGQALPATDNWFREGLYVIPEPSSAALGFLALAAAYLFRRFPVRWIRRQ